MISIVLLIMTLFIHYAKAKMPIMFNDHIFVINDSLNYDQEIAYNSILVGDKRKANLDDYVIYTDRFYQTKLGLVSDISNDEVVIRSGSGYVYLSDYYVISNVSPVIGNIFVIITQNIWLAYLLIISLLFISQSFIKEK